MFLDLWGTSNSLAETRTIQHCEILDLEAGELGRHFIVIPALETRLDEPFDISPCSTTVSSTATGFATFDSSEHRGIELKRARRTLQARRAFSVAQVSCI